MIVLFAQNSQKESHDIHLDHMKASSQIVLHAPELIIGLQEGKLYLDERQIHKVDHKLFFFLPNGDQLFIPLFFQDRLGLYLPTLNKVGNKLFKCVCNNCDFEWEAGVFDFWCPNCGSSDFSVFRNK